MHAHVSHVYTEKFIEYNSICLCVFQSNPGDVFLVSIDYRITERIDNPDRFDLTVRKCALPKPVIF